MVFHEHFQHFGPVSLMLSCQKNGQGASERLHNAEKRSQDDNQKKTYERKDSVTVLGMVCEKMAERVAVVRQKEEDRRIREETLTVVNLHDTDSTGQEVQEDDEGAADEREI